MAISEYVLVIKRLSGNLEDLCAHQSNFISCNRYFRECGKDYVYKGKTIPKGCVVNVSSFLVQKDPEYWKDPEMFDPLRYSLCIVVFA